jgi:hypothetical protein
VFTPLSLSSLSPPLLFLVCAHTHQSLHFFLVLLGGNQHTQQIRKKGKTCKHILSPHTHMYVKNCL